jgi:hypothetical protein
LVDVIPKVDIGIACSGAQKPRWWANIIVFLLREKDRGLVDLSQIITRQSAMPDVNKTDSVGGVFASPEESKRNNLTDANRDTIVGDNESKGSFLGGSEHGSKADWIFWIDDDTVPPDGTISKLLRLEKDFSAGLYFNGNYPYNPIAYKYAGDGFYTALWDYSVGSVLEMDSVGMGCTLIHRSVYEKILDAYQLFQRPTGSLVPILKKNVYKSTGFPQDQKPSVYVENDWLHMKLIKPTVNERTGQRLFPFYCMEYGRTEDHYFSELAAPVGIKPWVDTSIVCEHWKDKAYTYEDYKKSSNEKAGLA